MFWNIWNLVLWRKAEKKISSCSDDYKYGEFSLGKSEQKLKTQSHFEIFDPVIGEGQWYDDAESHDLKFRCELIGNMSLLYSMKSFLDLSKRLVEE